MCIRDRFLDTRKYDLDAASNKILMLDNSQKHLFSSEYRSDAMKHWVEFHNIAYFGVSDFSGLLFELIMKELKAKHPQKHYDFCLELLDLERANVEALKSEAYNQDSDDFKLLNDRMSFLDDIKRGLWI